MDVPSQLEQFIDPDRAADWGLEGAALVFFAPADGESTVIPSITVFVAYTEPGDLDEVLRVANSTGWLLTLLCSDAARADECTETWLP